MKNGLFLGFCLAAMLTAGFSFGQEDHPAQPQRGAPLDIDALKLQLTDFNWVDTEKDAVVVGQVVSIENEGLVIGETVPTEFIYSKITLRICRSIVGPTAGSFTFYNPTSVRYNEDGEFLKRYIVGEAWITPGMLALVFAEPRNYEIVGGDPGELPLVASRVYYLLQPCKETSQQLYEFAEVVVDKSAVERTTREVDLYDCLQVNKRASRYSLADILRWFAERKEGAR
jgi:hypothetical protein